MVKPSEDQVLECIIERTNMKSGIYLQDVDPDEVRQKQPRTSIHQEEKQLRGWGWHLNPGLLVLVPGPVVLFPVLLVLVPVPLVLMVLVPVPLVLIVLVPVLVVLVPGPVVLLLLQPMVNINPKPGLIRPDDSEDQVPNPGEPRTQWGMSKGLSLCPLGHVFQVFISCSSLVSFPSTKTNR